MTVDSFSSSKTRRYSFVKHFTLLMLLLGVLGIGQSAFGQKKRKIQISDNEDVVYLKDGSIIRGEMLELIVGVSVKIRILGGSTFVYKMEEVEKITAEPRTYSHFAKRPPLFKKRGYAAMFETGWLIGFQDGVFYTLRIVNGYQIYPELTVGIGTGLDFLAWGPLSAFPISLDVRGDIIRNKVVTPFYYSGAGYNIPGINGGSSGTTSKGGYTAYAGIGVKFYTRNISRYTISVGLKLASLQTRWKNWQGDDFIETRTMQRMNIMVGMWF